MTEPSIKSGPNISRFDESQKQNKINPIQEPDLTRSQIIPEPIVKRIDPQYNQSVYTPQQPQNPTYVPANTTYIPKQSSSPNLQQRPIYNQTTTYPNVVPATQSTQYQPGPGSHKNINVPQPPQSNSNTVDPYLRSTSPHIPTTQTVVPVQALQALINNYQQQQPVQRYPPVSTPPLPQQHAGSLFNNIVQPPQDRNRSATPTTYRRLPNGELVEINPAENPIDNKKPELVNRSVSPIYKSEMPSNNVQPIQNPVYSVYPLDKSLSPTPGGTRYDVSKPHQPTYQKSSITPERYYQGQSKVLLPQQDYRGNQTQNIALALTKTTVVKDSGMNSSPIYNRGVENINLRVLDSRDHNKDPSVYAPYSKDYNNQSFGNSIVRDASPTPRRERVIIQTTTDKEIILNESTRPDQYPNVKREIINSKSQTREKMTQTPDKVVDLVPETTKIIEISPTKKAETAQKRQPSYLATGRYSEHKSPAFNANRNRSRSITPYSALNVSTAISDNSNIQDTRQIRVKTVDEDARYDQFQKSSIINPNLMMMTQSSSVISPKRTSSQRPIDPHNLHEGDQINEEYVSGCTTQAVSVEKSMITEDIFLPELEAGEYVVFSIFSIFF